MTWTPSPTNERLTSELAALVSHGVVSTAPADRVAYARDLWPRKVIGMRGGDVAPAPPAVVVWPSSVDELCAVVRYAAERGTPLVPFGAGSGVCGGVEATADAIVVDMKKMRRVLSVNRDMLTVHAEAGILGQHLEDHLSELGFTLGHFPSSIYCSTLGGWLAARSAGQCSGRYGKIEDMVVSLSYVDGEGNARTVHRDGAGAELLPLLIGSEGILGVITDAELRISPAPAERAFASFNMPTVEAGLHAIRDIYQAGLRPAVARLYDPFDTKLARSHKSKSPNARHATNKGPGVGAQVLARALRVPGLLNKVVHGFFDRANVGSMLVLVWEDTPDVGRSECARASQIAFAYGGTDSGEEPARAWLKRRHSVSYRQSTMYAAGAFVDTMEVAAPWSRLYETYTAVHKAISPYGFVMAHFSHAYPDGASIYFTFAGSASDDAEALRKYDALWNAALRAAVDAGASFSHHHGVGRSKAPAMAYESQASVDVVRRLKCAMDPHGIFNPGTLLPARDSNAVFSHRVPRSEIDRPAELVLDRDSLVVRVDANVSVAELQKFAQAHGATLATYQLPASSSVGEWLAGERHLFGSGEHDPVAQRVSGLDVALPDGQTLQLRPSPRRATGPDLLSLFLGMGGAHGKILAAHVVLFRVAEMKRAQIEFGNVTNPQAALASLRGRGVRLLDARTDAHVLFLLFDGAGELGALRTREIDAVVRHFGGRVVDSADPPPPIQVRPTPLLNNLFRENTA